MSEDPSSGLTDSVNRTVDVLSGRIPTTATVRSPRPEFLEVELVPLALVQRVEELHSDTSIFQGFFWAFLGGLLGLFVSVVLNGTNVSSIDKATWVAIVCLVSSAIVFWTLWQRASKRAALRRAQFYDETNAP